MVMGRDLTLGVTHYDRSKTCDGYTLFSPESSSNVWLIDMEGRIVHRWKLPFVPGCHGYLLPNGNLLYAGRNKTASEYGLPHTFCGIGGVIMEVTWDGELVWEADVPYQDHDFQVMPNGNVIFQSYDPEGIAPTDVSAKVRGGFPETELKGDLWTDCVFEINRQGERVWEWIAHKHLDGDIDTLCPLEDRIIWPYINALCICKDGGILLTTRFLNQITKIEYPSGKVVARIAKGKIAHPHDGRELENGNILILDNGVHRPGYGPAYTRVVEVDPETDEIVWEYKADPPFDFYSYCSSGAERLPNGNTLICSSVSGRIFEVTVEGEIVWEYVSPLVDLWEEMDQATNQMWRGHRYMADYPGLQGKELDPKNWPWENRLFGPEAVKAIN